MTVFRSKQPIRLSDNQLLGSGGEGSAYKVGSEVLKVYHQPLDRTFLDKMRELSPLVTLQNVVTPEEPLFDKEDRLIGYTMRSVRDPISLPLLFTTSYLQRTGILLPSTIRLAQRMLETTDAIHEKKILIVDGNEFNFLVQLQGSLEPFFIDVDSYQTPSFPATALHPNIQDYASTAFSEMTDWYSLAVITFQLFAGIHPYKGRATGFSSDDLAARCRARLSVLNPKVSYPKAAVRSFDDIPRGYRAWYEAIFEGGERLPPPKDPGQGLIRRADVRIAVAHLIVNEVFSSSSPIRDYRRIGTKVVVVGERMMQVEGSTMAQGIETTTARSLPLMSDHDKIVEVFVHEGYLHVKLETGGGTLRSDIAAERMFMVDDRLYALYHGNVQEIVATTLANNTALVTFTPMRVLESASKIMRGCVYMDVFGRPNFLIPYGFKLSTIFHSSETDGYKIVDAFYENGTLIIMGFKNGQYDRFTFKFNINGGGLAVVDHEVEQDVMLEEINATVLSDGMLVEIVANDLRLSAKGDVRKKVVEDVNLPAGASLRSDGRKVFYILGSSIYSVSMK